MKETIQNFREKVLKNNMDKENFDKLTDNQKINELFAILKKYENDMKLVVSYFEGYVMDTSGQLEELRKLIKKIGK